MRWLAAGLLLPMLGGCAALTATEAQQLAYRGEGADPCLFGGVTPEADRHCQELRQGLYGALLNLNTAVLRELGQGRAPPSCQLHVARVRDRLWQRPDLEVRSVFSCPPGLDGCHVSALVQARSGEAYVLDNGTVLKGRLYAGSVGRFGEFLEMVGGEHWFYPPVGRTLAATPALESPTPAAAAPAQQRRRLR